MDNSDKEEIYYKITHSMDKVRVEKVPPSRLPITRANVSLNTTPPAPKVHRARRTPPRSPAPPVTLGQGRSQSARRQNDYVEAPRRNTTPISLTSSTDYSVPQTPVICSQPEPVKDPSPENGICTESIICSNCHKCKCKSCATPRELPRKWMCGNEECSAQCAVEACTCLVLVKCLFDMCNINDHEHDMPLSDDPCACTQQPHCCKRWTVMGLCSLCLPCLCFYPLLKCGLMLCTSCYNRATRRGCTCRANKLPGSKRLLIESENSSST